MITSQNCSICAASESLRDKAQNLSKILGLPFDVESQTSMQLMVTDDHIELRVADLGSPIWIDFTEGKNAHRRKFGGGRGQALAKAVSLKHGKTPSIIDCTAGYGRDAFVLATLGCKITLKLNAIPSLPPYYKMLLNVLNPIQRLQKLLKG